MACFFLRSRKELSIVTCLFLSFAVLMMCYATLDSALPSMIDDSKALGKYFNKERASRILGFGSISYFISKLFSGFLIDRFGGRKMMICSLLFVSLFVLLFGIAGSISLISTDVPNYGNGWPLLVLLIAIWFGTRSSMSLGWPAMAHVVAMWFSEERLGKVFGCLSISAEAGYMFGHLFLGFLMMLGMNWKWCFIVSATFTFIIALLDIMILKDKRKTSRTKKALSSHVSSPLSMISNSSNINNKTQSESPLYHIEDEINVEEEEDGNIENRKLNQNHKNSRVIENDIIPDENNDLQYIPRDLDIVNGKEKQNHIMNNKTQIQAIYFILTSPKFLLIALCQISYGMIFELESFLPIYYRDILHQRYEQSYEGLPAVLGAFFSLGSMIGLIVGGFLYDQLKKRHKYGRIALLIVISMITTICAFVMCIGVTHLHLSIIVTTSFIMGMTVAPGWYIVGSVFSVELGGPCHCGKVSSLIDAVGYISASIFDFLGGTIVERVGWEVFFLVIAVFSFIVILAQSMFQYLDIPRKIIEHIPSEKTQSAQEQTK